MGSGILGWDETLNFARRKSLFRPRHPFATGFPSSWPWYYYVPLRFAHATRKQRRRGGLAKWGVVCGG
jgi:hypothetical protein